MSDTLIKVEGVSKKFCRSLKKSLWYGVQDLGNELLGRRHGGNGELRPEEFWAVKDVSFELKRGEALGLVGRNGAGKTTLLRLLNGLIKPDQGRIEMRGKVGALIALGAGFNPILTGRENIYVNASVLGLSKREIDAKVEEIVDFAEIGDFIDTPVQNYSSGMSVRLGFAISTALDPDILLLDEILAVGDAAFRFKCHRRIDELLKHAAVIFVSHDMAHVARICEQTLVLDHGSVRFQGSTATGIEIYREANEGAVKTKEDFLTLQPPITSFEIRLPRTEMDFGDALVADIDVISSLPVGQVSLRINVFSLSGAYVADCVIESGMFNLSIDENLNRWHIELDALPLKAGRYLVSFSISDTKGGFLAVSYKRHEVRITGGHPGTVSDCQLIVRKWSAIQ
jgi:lipopolysaccharide transport system ATP-binding protein